METVNIHAAKTHLSRLVERVEAGEEIVIARAGKPVARLVRYSEAPVPRVHGSMEGKIWIAADFDAPLPAAVLEASFGDGGSEVSEGASGATPADLAAGLAPPQES